MGKKVKILHVVNISFVLPYFLGDQFDFFRNFGYDLHVACSPSTHLREYSKVKKFKFLETPILRKVNLLKDIISIYNLVVYIKRNNIDIIIGHTPKGGLISMIAALISRTKLRLYFRHGLMYETSTGITRVLLILIEKITGFLAYKVICVSTSVLQISNMYSLSNSKKNILLANGTCNGIDAKDKYNLKNVSQNYILKVKKELNINQDDLVIGYVGRLVTDKGIIELLDAWEILKFKFSNIKLLLVGPFEERDSISDTYKNKILTDPSIIYTGPSDNTIIYYAIMDIFVLLSYREGFPTVVLEASSMELPIVTTKKTGCIDSILANETGVFTNLDVESIVKNITFYIENKSLRKEHGKNGRDFVLNNFQQEIVWKSLKNVIETI